jgi:hypothetical protein
MEKSTRSGTFLLISPLEPEKFPIGHIMPYLVARKTQLLTARDASFRGRASDGRRDIRQFSTFRLPLDSIQFQRLKSRNRR